VTPMPAAEAKETRAKGRDSTNTHVFLDTRSSSYENNLQHCQPEKQACFSTRECLSPFDAARLRPIDEPTSSGSAERLRDTRGRPLDLVKTLETCNLAPSLRRLPWPHPSQTTAGRTPEALGVRPTSSSTTPHLTTSDERLAQESRRFQQSLSGIQLSFAKVIDTLGFAGASEGGTDAAIMAGQGRLGLSSESVRR
jgi:hypothetical protein